MCGRFELHSHPSVIALQFGLAAAPTLAPRYNIAPQTHVAVVRMAAGGTRELVAMRWGLIPFWAKEATIGARMINARAETVASKPAFRSAFRQHRCLLPADAFYEWKTLGTRKQPMRVARAGGGLLGLAGIYDSWRDTDGVAIETCSIVTTTANADIASIHDRMPVIIEPADYERWLIGSADAAATLLAPLATGSLVAQPVSVRVNNVRNDDAGLIEPLPDPPATAK